MIIVQFQGKNSKCEKENVPLESIANNNKLQNSHSDNEKSKLRTLTAIAI